MKPMEVLAGTSKLTILIILSNQGSQVIDYLELDFLNFFSRLLSGFSTMEWNQGLITLTYSISHFYLQRAMLSVVSF